MGMKERQSQKGNGERPVDPGDNTLTRDNETKTDQEMDVRYKRIRKKHTYGITTNRRK